MNVLECVLLVKRSATFSEYRIHFKTFIPLDYPRDSQKHQESVPQNVLRSRCASGPRRALPSAAGPCHFSLPEMPLRRYTASARSKMAPLRRPPTRAPLPQRAPPRAVGQAHGCARITSGRRAPRRPLKRRESRPKKTAGGQKSFADRKRSPGADPSEGFLCGLCAPCWHLRCCCLRGPDFRAR